MSNMNLIVITTKVSREIRDELFSKSLQMSEALNHRVTISDIIRLFIEQGLKGDSNARGNSGVPQGSTRVQ